MKKRITVILIALIMLLCACSGSNVPDVPENAEKSAIQSLRVAYRNSVAVIIGKCRGNHINSAGVACFDVEVEEVLFGDVSGQTVVHCVLGSMSLGREYLLYLSQAPSQDGPEGGKNYGVLTDRPLEIASGAVVVDNVVVSLDDLIADMRTLSGIIIIRGKRYYYDDIKSLSSAAEEIVIAQVTAVSEEKELQFRSYEEGASVEYLKSGKLITISVKSALKGRYKFGDELIIPQPDEMSGELLNAATLKPVTIAPKSLGIALEEGKTYIFLLITGPDSKQNYYFPINQAQGWCLIEGGMTIARRKDDALLGRELRILLEDIAYSLK